jgi:signal transduction histidine kinase
MKRIKIFVKKHVLRIGLIAVIIPLLIHLGLQYRSLAELESTVPVARRATMLNYLRALNKEITKIYRTKAEKTLDVPAAGFKKDQSPLIINHFRHHQFKGARRLFIGTIGDMRDNGYAIVNFYNPKTEQLERDPYSADWRAAHAGAATWMAMILTDTVQESPRLTVDERDPKNRLIVKPILNHESHVVGVAGMILDENVFLKDFLPWAIRTTLPKFFTDEADAVTITVLDSNEQVLYATRPISGKKYETGGLFPFVFTDWYLGIRMSTWTEDEMARRSFIINFSLSIITAIVLLGGVVLALRTASRAMKLSQMKADFVSNVSHELRTPLASIRVFGEFLKLGRVRDTEKIHEYGEYIETESRRLTQLINNILDFSKIESGLKTYRFEEADLKCLIEETLKLFEVRLEQSGFHIAFEAPSEPLPPTMLDRDAISQAFINLLDNAVKYSGGCKEITVRIGRTEDRLTISVIDRGVGIERDEWEKIFEKFYRVSTGLVHDVKGSGLGLSIVRHVIEAHQGSVTVESTPGRGSNFTLHLPIIAGKDIEPQESHPTGKFDGPQLQEEGLGA